LGVSDKGKIWDDGVIWDDGKVKNGNWGIREKNGL
jgi:hypothetical protein